MILQFFIFPKYIGNLFMLMWILTLSNFSCTAVTIKTLKHFGAKGDGVSDDTEALIKALLSTQHTNEILSGENLTYLLSGKHNLTLQNISLKDINIKLSKPNNQLSISLNCNNVLIENLKCVGTRNTEIEDWRVFTTENNVKSIMPVQSDIFLINALDLNSSVVINHVSAENIHARSFMTIFSFGKVKFDKIFFSNLSNKTIHVYHSTDDGKTVNGNTVITNAYADNIGLLSRSIRIDDSLHKTYSSTYMPQESFNFIVSFGVFSADNIHVKNYGSTGLTADRNTYFKGNKINISNTSNRSLSNNSSSSIWLEACKKVDLTSVNVCITNRSPTELRFDNSAVHIFGDGSKIYINNLTINSPKLVLNKGIRGSLSGSNQLHLGLISIRGKYKEAGISFSKLDDKNNSKILIDSLILDNVNTNFFGVNNINIGVLIGKKEIEEANFYIYENSKGEEKITIGNTNIVNIGVNDNVRNISIKKQISGKKVTLKKIR